MRKFFVLCAALFCLSLTASAQDSTAASDAASPDSDPAAPAPAALIPADREPWQLGVGFQYMHFNVLDEKFHDFGYQADITRYLSNRFGVEGMTVLGFGNAGSNPTLDAKSFFIGGGPHVSLFDSNHVEVWKPAWKRRGISCISFRCRRGTDRSGPLWRRCGPAWALRPAGGAGLVLHFLLLAALAALDFAASSSGLAGWTRKR
jgi:hypothetical protein